MSAWSGVGDFESYLNSDPVGDRLDADTAYLRAKELIGEGRPDRSDSPLQRLLRRDIQGLLRKIREAADQSLRAEMEHHARERDIESIRAEIQAALSVWPTEKVEQ